MFIRFVKVVHSKNVKRDRFHPTLDLDLVMLNVTTQPFPGDILCMESKNGDLPRYGKSHIASRRRQNKMLFRHFGEHFEYIDSGKLG